MTMCLWTVGEDKMMRYEKEGLTLAEKCIISSVLAIILHQCLLNPAAVCST